MLDIIKENPVPIIYLIGFIVVSITMFIIEYKLMSIELMVCIMFGMIYGLIWPFLVPILIVYIPIFLIKNHREDKALKKELEEKYNLVSIEELHRER